METLADALQARSCAYRLLAFFMALPTRDVADSVLAGSLRADVEEIADGANFDPEEARRVTEALDAENSFWQLDAEEALRALRLDYTMLFTNPEGAVVSPYEARFKGSDDFDSSGLTFISPTALDAERVYRQLGIKPSGHSNESADHMGVETEFLGLVYEQLAGAVDDSGDEERQRLATILEDFDRGHFLKWGAAFFSRVQNAAQTPVYRALGCLGVALAASERDVFAGCLAPCA